MWKSIDSELTGAGCVNVWARGYIVLVLSINSKEAQMPMY